jgi:hypothetical protein
VGVTRRRRIAIGATVVAAAALGVALAADPLASWSTRRALQRLDGYSATFEAVDVRLRDLTYVVNDLRLVAEREGAQLASIAIERAEITLDPRALVTGDLVARVKLEAPSVRLVTGERGDAAEAKLRRVRAVAMPAGLPDALVERLDFRGGRILRSAVDGGEEWAVRVHAIEGSLENFATRPELAGPGPTSLTMRARLQGSGRLQAFVEVDPAAERITFSGSAELAGLHLTDIADLIEAKSDFEPRGGSFHGTLEVEADGGKIRGAVRPVVESPDLSPEGDGLAAAVKGAIADLKIDRHTDDREGDGKGPVLVSSIPIRGDAGERAEAIPTFLAIVAAGFARGLSDGLAVPPGSDEPTRVVPPRDRGSP